MSLFHRSDLVCIQVDIENARYREETSTDIIYYPTETGNTSKDNYIIINTSRQPLLRLAARLSQLALLLLAVKQGSCRMSDM